MVPSLRETVIENMRCQAATVKVNTLTRPGADTLVHCSANLLNSLRQHKGSEHNMFVKIYEWMCTPVYPDDDAKRERVVELMAKDGDINC